MICPNCGKELKEYPVENEVLEDVHTYYCEECFVVLSFTGDKLNEQGDPLLSNVVYKG